MTRVRISQAKAYAKELRTKDWPNISDAELGDIIDELVHEVEYLRRTTVPALSPKDQREIRKRR